MFPEVLQPPACQVDCLITISHTLPYSRGGGGCQQKRGGGGGCHAQKISRSAVPNHSLIPLIRRLLLYLNVELKALRRLMGVCLLFLLLALVAGVLVICCSTSGVLPLRRLPALLFSGVGVARAAAAESSELSEFSWRERFRLLFLIKNNFFLTVGVTRYLPVQICERGAPICQPELVIWGGEAGEGGGSASHWLPISCLALASWPGREGGGPPAHGVGIRTGEKTLPKIKKESCKQKKNTN
jgi:hypothetical protein